jgi:hypothetical protein
MRFLPLAVICLASACGGSPDGPDQSEQDATGSAFPAFAKDVARAAPQLILGNGGPVIQDAKLVTITFASDDPANVATIERFSDGIGKSAYWRDALLEYGVRGLSSASPQHIHVSPDDMPRMTHGNTKGADGTFHDVLGLLDSDLVSFLVKHATNGDWPRAADDTLYAVYIPKSIPLVTRISTEVGKLDRMDACESFEGFHFEKIRRGRESDTHMLYTIIDEACGDGTIDNTTDTASHELAEGVTDPFASTNDTAALNGFNSLAWTVFNEHQEEIGDACEFYPDVNVTLSGDFAFRVQGLWSNRAARAGKNPCAPNDGSPYYNVVPLAMDQDIEVVVPPRLSVTSKTVGYRVPGGSRTISLGLFSDRPTSGPWKVSAVVGGTASTIVSDTPKLDNGEDRVKVNFVGTDHGKNGDTLKVQIDVDPDAHAEHGKSRTGVVVTFVSEKEGLPKRYTPVMIGLR